MATATLSPGFKAVALKLQEASMMHSDVRSTLGDAINDHHKGTGKYGYYIDHDGDGTEGNCIYSCDSDIRQAPYEIGSVAGKAPQASIDFDSSKNVLPVTNYVPEAEDSDHYTSMDEAFRAEKIYTDLPVYERFISTKTRKAADSGSFAGKGRSFPILKAEDVSAALHSLGRAGSGNYDSGTIRANIKKIAKAKGFALPDSLKDETDKEAWKPEGVELRESAHFIEAPTISEGASASFPILLINEGRGSSGYYSKDVLKKAAENKVFKAGTQMFWNHDTDQEESSRPEGDLNRLAAVTTSDAKWDENGKDGPGIYAHAKVFSDYADKVKEMGPHIGLSIRAGGDRDESARGPDGKPRVITALRNAASVDFVTKAGRGGKIFTESATHEGDEMDKTEIQALIKESLGPLQAENKQLREMLAATRGPALIAKHLEGIRFPAQCEVAIKGKITEALSLSIPMTEAGAVDDAKLKTLVEAKAKEWAKLLPALGYNVNPASMGTPIDPKDRLEEAARMDADRDQIFEGLAEIFVGPKLPKGSVDDEKRSLRKVARESFMNGRAA